jgi:hypothetical protein
MFTQAWNRQIVKRFTHFPRIFLVHEPCRGLFRSYLVERVTDIGPVTAVYEDLQNERRTTYSASSDCALSRKLIETVVVETHALQGWEETAPLE